MPSAKNIESVSALTEKIKASKSIVFLNYRGVDASTKSELRKKVAEAGEVEYLIAKNRLFKVALKHAQINDEKSDEFLKGPTSFVFSYSDTMLAPKISKIFVEECKVFEIKGGFIESKVVNADYITKVADLPPREVLIAQLAATLKLPVVRLCGAMNYNLRGLVNVL